MAENKKYAFESTLKSPYTKIARLIISYNAGIGDYGLFEVDSSLQ